MYAGISSGVNSASNALDNDTSSDIPEWKKLLIMKKRAGNSPSADEYTRRNLDSSAGDNLPPKTVTIGNINVELRSVGQDPCTEVDSASKKKDDSHGEDIRYGPGIVDRLRAKFLSICAQKECKPVVRRFSSLENLPGSSGPYRVNTRGLRQNGFRASTGNYCTGNVKKAQSMETLVCVTPEQQIFASSRRPNARYVGGVKARILAKNISPICTLTDENDEPNEKTPSPASSPRLFAKSLRRWDYNRSTSASNINEDELPKRDTVKHVKKMFESPPVVNSSEKPSNHPGGLRFRKIPGTIATPTSSCNNGAISGSVRPAVKKPDIGDDCLDAKTSAKELSNTNVNIPAEKEEEVVLSPDSDAGNHDDNEINKGGFSPVLEDNLSAIRSCDTLFSKEDRLLQSPDSHRNSSTVEEENTDIVVSSEASVKVTVEQLPLLDSSKHSEVLSQGSRVSQPNEAEPLEDDLPPHPRASGFSGGMVVAAAASSGDPLSKKGNTWQKAPQATTSVVFDFRGKDVKPNIAINPAPFGCRPAKVSRSAKRAGSPPRSGVNGIAGDYGDEVDEPRDDEDDDLEDWDQMDVGADLPVISGIVFTGENVKVGRGALLETRNKKLSIQFDDRATSTFEYPSENASPSPMEENGYSVETFNSSVAMSSAANSRLGLSTYTPQVLSSSKEFELGISQPNHRSSLSSPDSPEVIKDVPSLDVLIPANPNDTGGWSATETADILF
ncbi:uncharacterized protein LOC129219080 [Uloborus diversus]|uniref:uncharacterized protein LOC129219080 n=1 Tax=Uloborus diversus TaxID=327109 RepID=UPI00240A0405|nr:uncharacterized protein LOC129219080 [Uloborus diversus]